MKLNPKQWCKIQEHLANLNCPHCFSAKVTLNEESNKNATCKDCGCKFEFNPDLSLKEGIN